MRTIYIYDPTASDAQSQVRGVGRYMQTMKEAFTDQVVFTSTLKDVTIEDILINPFYTFTQKPLAFSKKADKQIALIHDLIPLKYPHHFPTGIKGMIFTFLNKWGLKNYDLIVTDSMESKKSIINILKIPEQKIEVIYPTVPRLFLPHLDPSEESPAHHHPFHKEHGHSVPEFSKLPLEKATQNQDLKNLRDFVLYVGDSTWNKNLLNMAAAIQSANLTCVCVGKIFAQEFTNALTNKPHPWQRMLYSFINFVHNDKRFIFPGFMTDVELLALYQQAHVNILVSHDEGFGLSYIESGYMGTPSVLADIPVFREIAKDSAEFANPNDPKDIAQKIAEVYFDKIKQEKLRISAFNRAQDFSPERFRQRWLEVIQKIS